MNLQQFCIAYSCDIFLGECSAKNIVHVKFQTLDIISFQSCMIAKMPENVDKSKTRNTPFFKVNTPEPILIHNLGKINMLLKSHRSKNANITLKILCTVNTPKENLNFRYKDQQFLSIDESKIMKV